jgi:hypothetical protein
VQALRATLRYQYQPTCPQENRKLVTPETFSEMLTEPGKEISLESVTQRPTLPTSPPKWLESESKESSGKSTEQPSPSKTEPPA